MASRGKNAKMMFRGNIFFRCNFGLRRDTGLIFSPSFFVQIKPRRIVYNVTYKGQHQPWLPVILTWPEKFMIPISFDVSRRDKRNEVVLESVASYSPTFLHKTACDPRWPRMTYRLESGLVLALLYSLGCIDSHRSRCSYGFPLLQDSRRPGV